MAHPYLQIKDSTTVYQELSVDDLGSLTPPTPGYESKKCWRAPILMSVGLFSGLALGIAHHLFYNHLDAQVVTTILVPQEWVFRVGNALAILVKLSFSTVICVAFVQAQWSRFRRRAFTFKDLDNLSGMLGDITCLIRPSLWIRYPILVGLAIITWLLPLIPVVVPGSLTIVPIHRVNTTSIQVPQLDTHKTDEWTQTQSFGGFVQDRPSGTKLLSQLAWSTAVGGQILPIPSVNLNQSYQIDFIGPAIRCYSANESYTRIVSKTLDRKRFNSTSIYYSWGAQNFLRQANSTAYPHPLDTGTRHDNSKIWVMTDLASNITVPGWSFFKLNVTECVLYNASYKVAFDFHYPAQDVSIQTITYLNPISLAKDYWNYYETAANRSHYTIPESAIQARSYFGLWYEFGSILLGKVVRQDKGGLPFQWYTSMERLNIDFSSHELPTIQRGLEELFRNMTLSLLNRKDFWRTTDSAEWVPVTVSDFVTTYAYNQRDLLLSYGLSLLISALCAGIGFMSFKKNEGSYQNIFSTFVRATYHTRLHNTISRYDDGADPLPSALGKAKIDIARSPRAVG